MIYTTIKWLQIERFINEIRFLAGYGQEKLIDAKIRRTH
jgi:hypothetical protein